MNRIQQIITPNLFGTLQQLSSSLKAIPPISSDNQTSQLITYPLIATAVVAIFVYHYLRNQAVN